MSNRRLREFLDLRRSRGEPVVLATVFDTDGSTYSKAGARMLIDADGRFQGMLSGGCLEGDLAVRARVAIESGTVQYARYDLGTADDELWGMGVGCDGAMRILLQPLRPGDDYEPASAILELETGRAVVRICTCIESTAESIPAGACVVTAGASVRPGPASGALLGLADAEEVLRQLPAGDARLLALRAADGDVQLLVEARKPLPRLLVLGAGLDAEPVLRLADTLGWQSMISDHRPAYVNGNRFPDSAVRHCLPAGELAGSLSLDEFDLAIVMSHHLASDRLYLAALAESPIGYIGLLGPPGRRDRLLAELGERGRSLAPRLHAPAGLDLGGRGPAAIALSIVAEMQQYVSRGGRRGNDQA